MCPCGTTIQIRIHILIVGECEVYKEERDALEEEMMNLDVCYMEEFGRLECSEETIAILGERDGGPRRQHRTGIDRKNKQTVSA